MDGALTVRERGDILLVSTYELGHQPFALAALGSFLERAGFAPSYVDTSVENPDEAALSKAKLVAISVPMHTALRLGAQVFARVRESNPRAKAGFFGLYAPLNGDELLGLGADFVLGGECEPLVVELAEALSRGDEGSLHRYRQRTAIEAERTRLDFPPPSRRSLPPLSRYARLVDGGAGRRRLAGHVEASRGCLHLCRHCPIPPAYGGRFFVLPEDIVLRDIAAQVESGATHVTFGDPDFLNGPGHSLRIVRKMHDTHPGLTFDFTAKVEHLLRHRALLHELARLGLSFVVSAVESLSDVVLSRLAKGHTRDDVEQLFDLAEEHGITLRPSFVSFTPWTTLDDYRDVLRFIERRGIVDWVDPVQLAIRLLIPPGSLLLEQPDVQKLVEGRQPGAFTHSWRHPDPAMDDLYESVSARVEADAASRADAAVTFSAIRSLAGIQGEAQWRRRASARLTESWFCCAEPTRDQLVSLAVRHKDGRI
jgi:radical SAM superfamily enzyme YgiQ (UPF0313 family)